MYGYTLFTFPTRISGLSLALTIILFVPGNTASRLGKATAAFNYDFPRTLHPSIPLSCSCRAGGAAPGLQLHAALVCCKIFCTCFVPRQITPASRLLTKASHAWGKFHVVQIRGGSEAANPTCGANQWSQHHFILTISKLGINAALATWQGEGGG